MFINSVAYILIDHFLISTMELLVSHTINLLKTKQKTTFYS